MGRQVSRVSHDGAHAQARVAMGHGFLALRARNDGPPLACLTLAVVPQGAV